MRKKEKEQLNFTPEVMRFTLAFAAICIALPELFIALTMQESAISYIEHVAASATLWLVILAAVGMAVMFFAMASGKERIWSYSAGASLTTLVMLLLIPALFANFNLETWVSCWVLLAFFGGVGPICLGISLASLDPDTAADAADQGETFPLS